MKNLLILSLLLCFALTLSANAAPYYPHSDDELVEALPMRTDEWREIGLLRRKVQENPNRWPSVQQLVSRYIEMGRAASDPRYFGYAEALLRPWLEPSRPNAHALILRATLLQNRHEFVAAMRDLDRAISLQPRSAQAWLTRASIQQAQGDYSEAWRSCRMANRITSALTSTVCTASTLSLSGGAAQAYVALRPVVKNAQDAPLAERQWAWTVLAEIAERLGNIAVAELDYREALRLPAKNAYLQSAYADFLLHQGRDDEVIALLKDEIRADGLLLRLVLAESHRQEKDAAIHVEALKSRFAAARMRGDITHQGDEARFLLQVLHQPQAALALAQANWRAQREPRDALILLEAAEGAGSPESAEPVLAFMARSGLEDVRLQTLLEHERHML